ncbi:hypothetical protein C8R44DRAFT_851772 [Mycena epipterygia]|nr:hypothetical protein C8R44DRAFT_851772 [Mycena epipterygia]
MSLSVAFSGTVMDASGDINITSVATSEVDSHNSVLNRLKALYVPDALYNSETRIQKEDGRFEFIGQDAIVDPIRLHLLGGQPPRICFVTGPAGYGKTAIAHRIAQLFAESKEEGVMLAGTFFFCRGSRENGKLLFATLALQLKRKYAKILDTLEDVPDNLQEQVQQMILDPLAHFDHPGMHLFIIDALDECNADDANRIIDILTTIRIPPSVRFLLTARKNPDLDWDNPRLASLAHIIDLQKMAHRHIDMLLRQRYGALPTRVKRLLRLEEPHFRRLAALAGGSPLYVVMIIRYLGQDKGCPMTKLKQVMEGKRGLDVLYMQVFEAGDWESFKPIAKILLAVYLGCKLLLEYTDKAGKENGFPNT